MGVAVGDIIGLKQYKENNMANLPVPPKQPPASNATILQKLLDQQIETNKLLQKSITLQQEKNKKTDLIIDALSSILKWVKNINNWAPGRIVIGQFGAVILLFVIYQLLGSLLDILFY